MKWFSIIGFEGRYECTEDGMRVRSCARHWWYGNAEKISRPKEIKRRSSGAFVLRDEASGRQHQIHPEALITMLGKEVEE